VVVENVYPKEFLKVREEVYNMDCFARRIGTVKKLIYYSNRVLCTMKVIEKKAEDVKRARLS
jgi:hypothetical protein